MRLAPLPLDFAGALTVAAKAQAKAVAAGPHSPERKGVALLLQVQPDKEVLLGWQLPDCLERQVALSATARDLTSLPAELLAGLTVGLRVPLLLAAAHRVEFEDLVDCMEAHAEDPEAARGLSTGEESIPEDQRTAAALFVGDQFLVAVCVPPAAQRNALQSLMLASSAGVSDASGTWLFECDNAGDQSALLQQLQLAGCLMQDIGLRYRVGHLLGIGASSRVFLAEDVYTGEEVAVKMVTKAGPEKDIALLREATILRWAAHPRVLQFRGLYEVEQSMGFGAWGIVTEFVGGGELFEEVRQKGPFTEDRACDVIRQLLSALDYLHHRGVVHRDIKTENVCKTGVGDEVKLVDFGLATPEWDRVAMVVRCGSPGYIAPEVLRGERYGCKVDCFSVGVLMYILLAGYGPFRGGTLEEMLFRNARCKVSLRGLAQCTDEAKDLVMRLLVPSGDDRPSAELCLAHPWFSEWPSPEAPRDGEAGTGRAVVPGPEEKPRRRLRRRLFSEELGYTDMFFKELKFADETPEDDSASTGRPTPGEAHGDGRAMQNSRTLTSPTGSTEIGEAPAGRAPSTQPSSRVYSGDQILHPNMVEEPTGNSAPLAGGMTEPAPQPMVMFTSEATGIVINVTHPSDSPTQLRTDMFRTCEPIWADVQRTLSSLRGQGLIPSTPGKKSIQSQRQAGNFRGGLNTDEPERFSAFYTRDVQKNVGSFTRDVDLVQERQTAFYHRDLGQGNGFDSSPPTSRKDRTATVDRPTFGVQDGPVDRPTFGVAGAAVDRVSFDMVARARPSHPAQDEERTSAFFTRRQDGDSDSDSVEELGVMGVRQSCESNWSHGADAIRPPVSPPGLHTTGPHSLRKAMPQAKRLS